MLIINTDYIEGKKLNPLGLVTGCYEEKINSAKSAVIKEMMKQASDLKADAIINVRFSVSRVSLNCAFCFASGTAVKFA